MATKRPKSYSHGSKVAGDNEHANEEEENDFLRVNSELLFDMDLLLPIALLSSLTAYAEAFNQSLLSELLPPNYVDETIPTTAGKPLPVYINLEILQVGSISETSMDFQLHMYMFERWRDERLILNEDPSPGITLPVSITDRLWKPTVVFDNAKRSTIASANRHTVLFRDKFLLRVTRYSFSVQCDVDLSFFPLDVQHCPFTIRSLSNSDSLVDLIWTRDSGLQGLMELDSVTMHSENQDLRFSVQKPVTDKTKLSLSRGTFTVLYANFTFSRELTSRVVKTYLPSSLVVMLSWAGFWIDIDVVPARVVLGITAVLTIVTQITQAFDVAYVNALDVWLFTCEFMVIAAVLEFVIAYTIAKRGGRASYKTAKKSPVPECGTVRRSAFKKLVDELTTKNLRNDHKTYVDKVSRVAFPLTFLMFVVWYWAALIYFTLPDEGDA